MKLKRKTSVKSVIPVSSMSDIAFLLLIFLMLSSILNMKKGPKINTPKAQEISTAQDVRKFDLTIDKNGNVFFEGSYVTAEDLTNTFNERIVMYPNLFVQINADEQTEYNAVDKVIKALQNAGCYRLLFICDKLKKE